VTPKKKSTSKKKSAVKKPAAKKKTASKKAAAKKSTAKKSAAAKKTAAKKPAASNKKAADKQPKKAVAKKKTAPKESPEPTEAPKEAAKGAAPPDRAPIVQPPLKRSGSRRAGQKVLTREFLFELANAIKQAVEPAIREMKGREIVSTATSGDATFELDRIAEKALLSYLKSARAPVAYYSEDAGYSTFSSAQPKNLLVVDPIDGTRAAKSGFEGCVISIASTRVIERPVMADVDNACVMELLGPRTFYAERGKGARIYENGKLRRPKLSTNTDLEKLTWSMTVPGRPAELIFPTSARLIDLSSLKGGFFACNSTSHSLTRLLTGQLDAAVDFAGRFVKDIPNEVRDYFINAGRGSVLGIAPYDLAASLLIVQEAGCHITDAFGRGFDDVLLLDSSEANHQSLVAASSRELHRKLASFFDTRIKQFETLLKRRAGAKK